MIKRATSRASQRRGTTTIEFAFVAVPFFVLIFGCIEFARVGMVEAITEDAAFQAARHVMVAGSTKAEGIAEANRVLRYLGVTSSLVDVTPRDTAGAVQNDIDDDTSEITVTVRVNMAENSLWLGRMTGCIVFEKTCTVQTERHKGFYDGSSA